MNWLIGMIVLVAIIYWLWTIRKNQKDSQFKNHKYIKRKK